MISKVIIMKKATNIRVVFFYVLSISLGAYCIFHADSAKAAAYQGIQRCLNVLIPSLFVTMAMSGLLIKCGFVSAVGKLISPVSRRIFFISGESALIFLLSQIAGYPVGARLLKIQFDDGRLNKSEAELLSCVCFGSGGAFIFGCAAADREIGWLILISTFLSNVLILLLLRPLLKRHCSTPPTPESTEFSGDILIGSVTSAGKGMFEICCCVIIFSVVSEMLGVSGAVAAVLDITALGNITGASVPLLTGLISFGGICVFLQISAIFRGKLSIAPMLFTRICSGLLSFGICRFLLPFFISGEKAVWTEAVSLTSHSSPVPSLILLIMILFVMGEEGKIKRGCKSPDGV